MTRPATMPRSALTLSSALALLLAVPLLALGAVSPAAAADAPADPLHVVLDTVTPAAIPRKGPVVVTGVVRNTDTQPWTDVRAYPLTSPHPLTDAAAVDTAIQTPDGGDLGNRLLSDGEKLGDLSPGASVRFRLRVPRRSLQIDGSPGVYWLAVQVLGATRDGRDQLADGRARTLWPLVPARTRTVPLSLVVPVRQRVARGPDGRLRHAGELAQELSPGGRLGRLVGWAAHAPEGTLTWLIDPAVVQAATDVAAGNPDLGVHRATASHSPTPSSAPDPPSTGPRAAAPPAELTDQGEQQAHDWLTALTEVAAQQPVLALPYADPDVSALAGADPSLLAAGSRLARAVLTEQGITSTAAAAPPLGYIDPDALAALPRPATVLLTDHPASDTPVDASKLVAGTARVTDGRTIVVTASGITGAPAGSADSALQLRQRLVADAALRALGEPGRPVLVQLPAGFDPGDVTGAHFFRGLEKLPWLELAPLPTGTPTQKPVTASLPWPRTARRAQVPRRNLALAAATHRAGTALSELLDGEGPRVDRVVTGAAISAASYYARTKPLRARARVRPLLTHVRGLLQQVSVLGTDFVTLSGASGYLTVAMVNGLDEPVTVGLATLPGAPGVTIDLPDAARLAAGQRSTLRLQAHSAVPGVHVVRLVPVTPEGLRVGDSLVFNLRTSQVGQYFWGVLALLVVALVVLVGRRIRQRLTEQDA